MKYLNSVCVMLLLSGCISTYVEPVGDDNTANVKFVPNYKVPYGGSAQLFLLKDDFRCKGILNEQVSMMASEPRDNLIKILAPRKIHLMTRLSTGGAFVSNICSLTFELNVEVGEVYEIIPWMNGLDRTCHLKVDSVSNGFKNEVALENVERCDGEFL